MVQSTKIYKDEINLWVQGCIGLYCVHGSDGKVLVNPEGQAVVDKYVNNPEKSYNELGTEFRLTSAGINKAPTIFNTNYQVAVTEEFPAIVYFDIETQETVNDLYVTIKEFANTEAAKFITGERPIEELSNYFDEIDALGAQEYIKIHQDNFDATIDG